MAPDAKVVPHLFVIFGGTGDLAARKLLPALADLAMAGHIEEPNAILGVARSAEHDDASFRQWARRALADAGLPDDHAAAWCDTRLHYHSIGTGGGPDYAGLAQRIGDIERAHDLRGNRAFYLALPPQAFAPTIQGLGDAGLARSEGWTRLVIEKPFGRDSASARQLNDLVHAQFDESQLYRIDHYLGKETVQNLSVFRFGNTVFESLWNRDRIENVQITVAEQLGVEQRAGYYDKAGALRDMVQNHVTQLISLIAMEVPGRFAADAVRYEKVKLLNAIAPIRPENVVFGQYDTGSLEGQPVAAYRDEPGVAPGSTMETYVALKLEIDTWRWQGVPFYVRTGKRLSQRLTQIAVTFRRPPVSLFESVGGFATEPNILLLTLQPDEGFALCVDVKTPGEPFAVQTLPLHFLYREAFGPIPDAYRTLLLDVLTGDQTLFVHADEAEASWRLYEPLLDQTRPVCPYPAGSWGPPEAEELPRRRGYHWHDPFDVTTLHGPTRDPRSP